MSGPDDFRVARATRRAIFLAAALVVFVIALFLAGIGVAATLSRATNTATWSTWGNVGQTFESINAVFSGLAFAAIVVTFWIQLKELREQRLELQMQRQVANGSHEELRRSAQAHLRRLHMDLIKMSIDDPALAQVWPELEPDLPPERIKQYLYANLVLQHAWSAMELDRYDAESVRIFIRYMFSSPLMRAYWTASRSARDRATLDPSELAFIELAEQVFGERDRPGSEEELAPR